MSKHDNVADLLKRLRSEADQDRLFAAAKMNAREDGFRLLIPVIEKMREVGLSTAEIGRLFKFLGDEFCASMGDEGKPPA
jgi:hypothetical protein